MLIDLNVSYGPWPFQRFRAKSLAQLAGDLYDDGIERAFVSHLGGVLYPDPHPYNFELFEEARTVKAVTPVPVINPAFPGWIDCIEEYRAAIDLKAVKVYPNFHGYALSGEVMKPLASYLVGTGIPLLVQMRLEDERMRHPALDVQGVPVDDLIRFYWENPGLYLICLNAYLPEARRIGREAPGLGVDTAFTEWLFTMELLLEDLAPERIFFGSHAPFLYSRAGADKLLQAPIDNSLKRQVGRLNAEQLI